MSEPQRGRRAPRAIRSSDVRRFQGAIAACVAAGIAALLIAWIANGDPRSPGPISRPHRAAGLECASCHAAEQPASACTGCHRERSFVRAGHRALSAQGALVCTSCHRAHAEDGISFAPNGTVVLTRNGRDETFPQRAAYRPSRIVHVPLIAADACAGCHDVNAPRDPIASCLRSDRTRSYCFDEHRRAEGGARDAAWEAARAAMMRPPPPREPSAGIPAWLSVLGGLLIGLFVFAVARVRRKKTAPVTLPAIVEKVRLPQIDPNTCLGCYACVDACPYDVLAIEKYVAAVVRPKDCCGLILCEQVCPNGSLVITDGEPIEDRPRVSEALESLDTPGIYVAGDLTGAPLIKNAIHQGALAVREIAKKATRSTQALDVAIIGAGPAGISAALEAKARGLRYEVFEQGSVAESIRSFPRGKLVFDQPLTMPIAGELWLEECTKEDLLAKWLLVVRRERLAIREGHRVLGVERANELFVVRSIDPSGREIAVAAARVVLALGRRGSPRKLDAPIPDAALDRVHYSLADARSHAGARAVIVGLGDVAMETAVALARQPNTRVTLVHRGEGFERGKARNIAEARRLVTDGRIVLRLSTAISAVERDFVVLGSGGSAQRVTYDALFVMIGSLPPWPFLEAAGVHRMRRE